MFAAHAVTLPSEVVVNPQIEEDASSSTCTHRVDVEEEKTSIFELDDTPIVDLDTDDVRFYFVPSFK